VWEVGLSSATDKVPLSATMVNCLDLDESLGDLDSEFLRAYEARGLGFFPPGTAFLPCSCSRRIRVRNLGGS
jgi:hypothetical protein